MKPARGPSRRAGLVAALLVGALSRCASTAAAQRAGDEHAREAPASEGTLDNDVFLPIAEAAARALASGDQTLERARAADAGAEGARLLDATLDAWREALAAGGAGASTWLDPAPAAEHRVAEGLSAGVRRRLAGLSAAERARWNQRLAPAAEQALHRLSQHLSPAERAAGLAEIVRLFPLTSAALRATLALADLALESGANAAARGWLERAEEEAPMAGGELALLAALAARRALVPARPAAAVDAWQAARGCAFADSLAWNEPGRRPRDSDLPPERRPRPGGTFLADGRFALQTAGALLVLRVGAGGELDQSTRVRPGDFLGGFAPEAEFEAPPDPPGWPLLPLADRERLVVVVGRTRPGEPNALVALEVAPEQPLAELGLELGRARETVRLAWAVVGAERIEPSPGTGPPEEQALTAVPIPELEPLGDLEFQPGPVASADRIVVQARQLDGQVRAWLLAFDRRDGTLVWARWLAAGADRVPTQRFVRSTRRVAGQPLLALSSGPEGLVFAGTHLGLGVLFDALAGEPLWSFKNRRRPEHDTGWGGARPPSGWEAGEASVVLWAPMDSDRMYTLRPGPLVAGGGGESAAVLARPPAPLFQARALLGGDADEHLVLDDAGAARNLSARRLGLDRIDALELGQDERFAGQGLVSAQRAWVSTNRGLYLFDRTRELYLLDHEPFPPAGDAPPGGDLVGQGSHVLVVGAGAVWSFQTR